jgi:hypothetical protein
MTTNQPAVLAHRGDGSTIDLRGSVTDGPSGAARFHDSGTRILIAQLSTRDKDVVREAQRWTTGERGPFVEDPSQIARADVTRFVVEALRIGALALSATGQAQEVRAVERLLKDVGDRTAASTREAVQASGRAMRDASETVTRAAVEAKRAIIEADAQTRQEFTTAVSTAKGDLTEAVRRIFGGDSPELLERLGPVLDKFGADLDVKVRETTSDLLSKAAKQFDPSDPSSPMAKHAAELTAQHDRLTVQLEKQHSDLAQKVEELTTALQIQAAKTSLSKVTPIKGSSYEDEVHVLMDGIAAGLGGEYTETGDLVGLLPRCKKGDGLLMTDGGAARVLLEMTDSARSGWGLYLDEAERNRGAQASLGLVRYADQNGGHSLRVLGPRRVVMAFDPEHDDPELLRTVVMLLRTTALAAAARTGDSEIATAEEKISEALELLDKLDGIKKLAGAVQKNASTIESQCDTLNAGTRRLLDRALEALTGATVGEAATQRSTTFDGAA